MAAGLVPLCLQSTAFSTAERAYLAYYGLDFSEQWPNCLHSLGFVESVAERLAVHVWQQPHATATVLLVTGLFDHVGLFTHLIRFALERGSNVVAFDWPGHGLSTGERASIDSFDDYRHAIIDVLAAVATLPGERQVIAQSTGGAVIMDVLTRESPPHFTKVVLLAPLVRPRGWLWVRAGHALLHRLVTRLPRGFSANSSDLEFLQFVRSDPLQAQTLSLAWIGALRRWLPNFLRRPSQPDQLLVLQGDCDGTVDGPYNLRQIQRLFPAARMQMIAGAGHHLANETAAIRSDYLQLVGNYLDQATLSAA